MPQGDWIVDQIEAISRFLAAMVLKRSQDTAQPVDRQGYVTEEIVLWSKLAGMLRAGEINAAENLLFAQAERGDSVSGRASAGAVTPGLARRFYGSLARMSDEELADHDFSREEIADGLAAIARLLREKVPGVRGEDEQV